LPAVSGSWASSGIGIPTCPATSTRSSVRSRAPPMPGRSNARTSKRRATTLRARSSSAACSSAGRSAKAASAACSKAMRAADTPGSAAGGPDTAGGRWSGAGSRLHPRVREATTQQAGRGRPQPLGRRRANRPSGGTPVGRQGCLGGLAGRQRPGRATRAATGTATCCSVPRPPGPATRPPCAAPVLRSLTESSSSARPSTRSSPLLAEQDDVAASARHHTGGSTPGLAARPQDGRVARVRDGHGEQ
jgi:hypothetical protein